MENVPKEKEMDMSEYEERERAERERESERVCYAMQQRAYVQHKASMQRKR